MAQFEDIAIYIRILHHGSEVSKEDVNLIWKILLFTYIQETKCNFHTSHGPLDRHFTFQCATNFENNINLLFKTPFKHIHISNVGGCSKKVAIPQSVISIPTDLRL